VLDLVLPPFSSLDRAVLGGILMPVRHREEVERQDPDQNTSVVGNRKSQLLAPSRASHGFSLLPTSRPTGTRTASFSWGAPRLSARVVDRRHGADQRLWPEDFVFRVEQSGSFFFVPRAAGQSSNQGTGIMVNRPAGTRRENPRNGQA
jgi:hypothetical protein